MYTPACTRYFNSKKKSRSTGIKVEYKPMNSVRQLKNTIIFTNVKLAHFSILFRLTMAKSFVIINMIIFFKAV